MCCFACRVSRCDFEHPLKKERILLKLDCNLRAIDQSSHFLYDTVHIRDVFHHSHLSFIGCLLALTSKVIISPNIEGIFAPYFD